MNLLRPGHPARAALDKLQASIAELQEAMRSTERAPLALEDVREHVRRALKRTLEPGYAQRAFTGFGRFHFKGEPALPALTWDALILLLGADEVEKRILKLVTAEPYDRGLASDKREKALADLRGKLEQLELDEEREMLQLESEGFMVLRRADVRPKLLLGLWQQITPPTKAPREPAAARV